MNESEQQVRRTIDAKRSSTFEAIPEQTLEERRAEIRKALGDADKELATIQRSLDRLDPKVESDFCGRQRILRRQRDLAQAHVTALLDMMMLGRRLVNRKQRRARAALERRSKPVTITALDAVVIAGNVGLPPLDARFCHDCGGIEALSEGVDACKPTCRRRRRAAEKLVSTSTPAAIAA